MKQAITIENMKSYIEEKYTPEAANQQNIYFNKIKVKGSNVTLNYAQMKGEDLSNSTFNKIDTPLMSFNDAMQELKEDIIEICEFPAEWLEDVEVLGISLKYGNLQINDKLIGITITGLRRLESSTSPMVLNTPYKKFEDDKDQNTTPYGTYTKVLDIIEEAHKYLNGERATVQQELFKQSTREQVEVTVL